MLHHEKNVPVWSEIAWHFGIENGSATFFNVGSGDCIRMCLQLNIRALCFFRNHTHVEFVDSQIIDFMLMESATNAKCPYYASREQFINQLGSPKDDQPATTDETNVDDLCDDIEAQAEAEAMAAEVEAETAAAAASASAAPDEGTPENPEEVEMPQDCGAEALAVDLGLFSQPPAPKRRKASSKKAPKSKATQAAQAV